jgi:predicted acetyltransferase
VSRSPAMHDFVASVRSRPDDGASETWYLRHKDGYAAYRVAGGWESGWSTQELRLSDFVALTPDAHAALWHTLLGIDLVTVVKVYRLPEDDPLPYLLTNHRAVQTTALNDGLWVNVLDVETCFGARRYATEDRLVVEATQPDGTVGRWSIEGGPDGATAKKVRTRPDLTMTWSALGSLLYGGIRPSMLAAGRRLTPRNDDALRRADLFFTWPVAPYCQTPY